MEFSDLNIESERTCEARVKWHWYVGNARGKKRQSPNQSERRRLLRSLGNKYLSRQFLRTHQSYGQTYVNASAGDGFRSIKRLNRSDAEMVTTAISNRYNALSDCLAALPSDDEIEPLRETRPSARKKLESDHISDEDSDAAKDKEKRARGNMNSSVCQSLAPTGNALLSFACPVKRTQLLIHPSGSSMSALKITPLSSKDSLLEPLSELELYDPVLQLTWIDSSNKRRFVARTACNLVLIRASFAGDAGYRLNRESEWSASNQLKHVMRHNVLGSCKPKVTVLVGSNTFIRTDLDVDVHFCIRNLQQVGCSVMSAHHPLVIWSSAESYIRPRLCDSSIHGNPFLAERNVDLFSVDLRCNQATHCWSPSHSAHYVTGTLSVTQLMVDTANEHTLFATTQDGTLNELDTRSLLRPLGRWHAEQYFRTFTEEDTRTIPILLQNTSQTRLLHSIGPYLWAHERSPPCMPGRFQTLASVSTRPLFSESIDFRGIACWESPQEESTERSPLKIATVQQGGHVDVVCLKNGEQYETRPRKIHSVTENYDDWLQSNPFATIPMSDIPSASDLAQRRKRDDCDRASNHVEFEDVVGLEEENYSQGNETSDVDDRTLLRLHDGWNI